MAYTINDKCIQCGVCQYECPEDAIHEIEGAYYIDPTECNDCGSCASICPVEACFQE